MPKVSEKKRQLREIGCYKVAEGGNHEIWYSPVTGKRFPIPRHNTEELKKKTEQSINRASGLK